MGISIPYDLIQPRRFRPFFDRIDDATVTGVSVTFGVIWLLYPVPLMLQMLKIVVLRGLGLMACFGLSLSLPAKVGARGVAVQAAALIAANSTVVIAAGYLWITPGLQVLATFGIGLAMLASIASSRLEPLYTYLEIVMIDGACARMP